MLFLCFTCVVLSWLWWCCNFPYYWDFTFVLHNSTKLWKTDTLYFRCRIEVEFHNLGINCKEQNLYTFSSYLTASGILSGMINISAAVCFKFNSCITLSIRHQLCVSYLISLTVKLLSFLIYKQDKENVADILMAGDDRKFPVCPEVALITFENLNVANGLWWYMTGISKIINHSFTSFYGHVYPPFPF